MKAWVLNGIKNIQCTTVDKPVLKEDEVLIEVKAAGICGSDIPRIYETGAHVSPLILGHEFSGQIVQLGNEVREDWRNKRVSVYPLIPCKTCVSCKKKQYELCRNYSYLGSRKNGAFAEYVAVPRDNLIEIPDNVSYEEAAMMEPMAVAVHAMRRITPATDDKVVICGLGTIGMLLFMFLMDAGIKNILVIGNKEFQKQTALKMGLPKDCYCDEKTEDVTQWVMKHTAGLGADAFFECVGKNETFEQAVELTGVEGKICLVGNPYSDMALKQSTYWKILRNQLQVTGTWNSSFQHEDEDDWNYVMNKLKQRRIQPAKLITHRYSMENLKQGFEIMREKTQNYIKIMLTL